MTGAVEIWIPGEVVGKGRARSNPVYGKDKKPKMVNGRVLIRHVTPEKTRTYEGIVRSLAMDEMLKAGLVPMDGPVSLELRIICRIPESWPNWKKELAREGKVWPTTKPDSDNVEKAIKDAMNGVVWVDDVQVVADSKIKLYGAGEGVRAVVRPLVGLAAQAKRRAEV